MPVSIIARQLTLASQLVIQQASQSTSFRQSISEPALASQPVRQLVIPVNQLLPANQLHRYLFQSTSKTAS